MLILIYEFFLKLWEACVSTHASQISSENEPDEVNIDCNCCNKETVLIRESSE